MFDSAKPADRPAASPPGNLPARLQFFTLLLFSLFLCCGCSAEVSREPATSQETPEHAPYYLDLPALSPEILLTVVANPINFETEPVSLPGDLFSEVIYIRGLADSKVEELINSSLDEAYDIIIQSGLPPYRGIYRAVPDGAQLAVQNLYAYPTFNYNNILSVYVSSDLTYELPIYQEGSPETESHNDFPPLIFIGRANCLNFDLRSGRQILLPELFADPSTAMAYINDLVADKLAGKHAADEQVFDLMPFDTPLLAGPFKGLPDTQKYYLTNGGISIVIDYLNPEFDHNFYPAQIYLPFSLFDGHLAIEERFRSEKNALYMDTESLEIEFVHRQEPDLSQMIFFEEAGSAGNILTYLYYSYPNSLPKSLELKISELRREAEATLERLKNYQPESMDEIASCDVSISVNLLGPYYILRYSLFAHGIETAETILFLECYSKDGQLLKLADCFKPGFNYREALYSAYLEQSAWLGATTLSIDEVFRDLTFTLGSTELEFTLSGDDNYNMYYIPYRNLGFENLTIFDFNQL